MTLFRFVVTCKLQASRGHLNYFPFSVMWPISTSSASIMEIGQEWQIALHGFECLVLWGKQESLLGLFVWRECVYD